MDKYENTSILIGTLASEPELSHENRAGKFYKVILEIPRLTQKTDLIPVIFHENNLKRIIESKNELLKITGMFQSYKTTRKDRKHKRLFYVYARFVETVTEPDLNIDWNITTLIGQVVKEPVFRVTPSGKRICDLVCAVNSKNRTEYLPCICWEEDAEMAKDFEVGQNLYMEGHIQSREYNKKHGDGTSDAFTVYDFSIEKFARIPKEKESKEKEIKVFPEAIKEEGNENQEPITFHTTEENIFDNLETFRPILQRVYVLATNAERDAVAGRQDLIDFLLSLDYHILESIEAIMLVGRDSDESEKNSYESKIAYLKENWGALKDKELCVSYITAKPFSTYLSMGIAKLGIPLWD